jgi:GTP-binding protein LepA
VKRDLNLIRNFSIIAHIDHGKSTLADRIIEMCEAISVREMKEQVLDNMDIERERGITIKAVAVRMKYLANDGKTYIFNLIDTPGHVDFSYEVSRALKACDGAILVVDAAQGVEAQTLANAYLAIDEDLEILPVINKIDLPAANVESAREQIEEIIGLDASNAAAISAKNGINIRDFMETIVKYLPPPKGDSEAPVEALIFDSRFDVYQGVIVFVRVFNGTIKPGDEILFMMSGKKFEVNELGVFGPEPKPMDELGPGDVGYIIASIRSIADARVGDTVTLASRPAAKALSGYKDAKPMVFCGIYPVDTVDYEVLRDALAKLQLNDAAIFYEKETSIALGFGFRCGFLGLLHLEVVQERLEREFNLSLITSTPSVIYKILQTDGVEISVDNPVNFPDPSRIDTVYEPFIETRIYTPKDFVGTIMELGNERRGEFIHMNYISADRVEVIYHLPLAEVIIDFYDRLKSRTRGYGSMEYEFHDYRRSTVVKLDILINGDPVDALSTIVHRDRAQTRGREITERLKDAIPRQMFKIPIQAAIGGKVIARETISAMRKDVLAKCYGGDISRKKKLLEKQKAGKKKMKQIGKVDLPQEAFLAVLKTDN